MIVRGQGSPGIVPVYNKQYRICNGAVPPVCCWETASILSETIKEVDDLMAERQRLTERLAELESRHQQSLQKLQETTAVLNQIQDSHGWKVLSVYYKVRSRLIPRRIARIVKQAVALLLDMRLVSTSGLFDKDWYLQRNPDVARAGAPPLRHYLRRGALEGRDPNPFFDSDWYLQQNPDVAGLGANPLVHYLRYGASEGRDPSSQFDSDWYLEQNPDVVKAGMNPLAHYVLHGCAEGRLPRADLNRSQQGAQAEISSRAQSQSRSLSSQVLPPDRNYDSVLIGAVGEKQPILRTRPIASEVKPQRSITNGEKRRLLCVTHVLPYPPRAGNEYRIHRMLSWLATNGFDILLVVCPLPGCPVTAERLASACSVYSNLILLERDGTLWHQLSEGDGAVKSLDRLRPRQLGKLLREEGGKGSIVPRLLPIVRSFCPDLLVEVLLHVDSVWEPEIILSEYVFMARPLPLMRKAALRLVDTHDVFSTKHEKIVRFGVEDGLVMSPEEEASLLGPADLVIAIQVDEAAELSKLVPNKPIVTVGVDFELLKSVASTVSSPVVLAVGSDNALNVKGLRDFLRFAWPLVRREVPDAELRVIGAVGGRVEADDPSVRVLGTVEDLTTAYAEARVVINPAIAGTGLKVKTIECLCHLRPLVTWPSGVDGVEADVRSLCSIATDWYIFAQHVIHLCKSEDASQVLVRRREEILRRFSPDATYAPLKAALKGVHVGAR